jgi:hypothetical protein
VTPDDDGLEFTAHLVNNGWRTETVVLPGDGSESGWRTPIVQWTPALMVCRCGNINGLKPDEVIDLAPGDRVKLEGIAYPGLKPGLNRVRLELIHQPGMRFRGIALDDHDPEAMKKVRQSSPFRVTSNVVEVRVKDQ